MHSPNQPDEQWRPQKRPPLNTSDNWSPQSARDRLRMDSPWLHSNRSFSSNDVGDWPDWTLSRESTNDSLQKLDDDCGRPPLAPQQRFPPLCYDSAPRPSQAHTRSSSESTPAHSRLSSGSRVFQPFQQLESHWPDSTAAPDWASRVKQHMQNSFQEAPASLVDRDYLQLDAQEYRQLDHLDAQKEYRQLNHLDAQKEYRQLNVQTDFQKEYRAGHQFSNQQEYSYMPPSMQQSALQKDIGKHSDAFRSDAFRTGLAGSASSGQQLYAPTNLSTSTPQQQQMYTSSAPLHQHLYNPSSSGNSAAPLQQMYRHAAQAGMQRQQTYQQIHQKIHMPAKHDPALWADSAPQKPRQYQQRHDKPIGVFVYDFPPSVTLNELVSTFTPFGEIQNSTFVLPSWI